jgi:acyl-CoA synthetase (AMP-forming)/AMP-acid ligase II
VSSHNLGEVVEQLALKHPHKKAIIVAEGRTEQGRVAYSSLTFSQLSHEVDAYARGLLVAGVKAHQRVLFLVTPGIDFVRLVFAVKKIGAVPVFLDSAMGLKRLVACIAQCQPDVMIGIHKAHVLSWFFPTAFRTVRTRFVVGSSDFFGAIATERLRIDGCDPVVAHRGVPDDLGAIFFTSGSTGTPKGVEWLRRHFVAQVATWKHVFGLREDDVDLVTFPLFLLFSIAAGCTCVLPQMDFSRPGTVQPENILQAMADHAPTFSFGSPALWTRVVRFAGARQLHCESLRILATGGAPVSIALVQELAEFAPEASVRTPFGATEALPMTDIDAAEILGHAAPLSARGRGTCVGKPVEGVTLRIIEIGDEAIDVWSDDLSLPAGRVGEIVVKGAVVTERYHGNVEATRLSKIQLDEETGARGAWHRTGDVGYLDEEGRLWFCGRKSHIVHTPQGAMYSVAVEGIFDVLPSIERTALVNPRGQDDAALVVELAPDTESHGEVLRRIQSLIAEHGLPIRYVLRHQKPLPVDKRHNAKIDRPALAHWAFQQMQRGTAIVVQP